MSIKITAAGKIIDRDVRYETKCANCGTKYSFQYEDITDYSGGVDANGNLTGSEGVSCPSCRVIHTVSRSSFYREKTFLERFFQ